MSEFETPADLRYTAEHEWVQRTSATTARIGITAYAQSQLGDVVFVQLPETGTEVTAGESFGVALHGCAQRVDGSSASFTL